jgi:hypothetical protein
VIRGEVGSGVPWLRQSATIRDGGMSILYGLKVVMLNLARDVS